MSKIGYFAAFITGAAVGSAASWYFLKTKYERIANEEIESVKEVFSRREAQAIVEEHVEEESNEIEDESDEDEDEPDLDGYSVRITDYSTEVEQTENDAPYVISPEEFGEDEYYKTISLTFYSDHILTDDLDEPIEDIEGTVGFDSLNHFGEYEDDSVFVRNDRLKVDYEILLDTRKYTDVAKQRPRRMEGFYDEE